MNFTEGLAEIVARGAQDDATRNGRWFNMAYREIYNSFDWPFAEATATGSAGAGLVTITDFRKAIYVSDISGFGVSGPGNGLQRVSKADLRDVLNVTDFSTTGTPMWWYYDQATTTVFAWPVGGQLSVNYFKRIIVDLSGVQIPAFDTEYHPIIVDRAMVEVYVDMGEMEQATELRKKVDRDLAGMAQHYEVFSREPMFVGVVDPQDG